MSTTRLVPLDVADDAQLRAAYGVVGPGRTWGREGAPEWLEHEFVGAYRSPDDGEKQESYLAVEGGTALGLVTVYLPLADNLTKAYADVVVHPAHRGRGVGAALLERVEEVARTHQRTELLTDSNVPFDRLADHPYRRFAEQHGYTLSNVEVVRHQALPVPDVELDAWASRAAARASGYRIDTYVDEFPAELAPSLCTLLGQLAVDAPTGDVEFEEEAMTPERLRQRQELTTAMGRRLFETVAVKDGVVAAQTTLSVPLTGSDAFQWGTFVHREHRGHSLGLAVKVANLRAVQAAQPDLRRVTTQNAETNAWMIAINELMGYVPFEAACDFVRRI